MPWLKRNLPPTVGAECSFASVMTHHSPSYDPSRTVIQEAPAASHWRYTRLHKVIDIVLMRLAGRAAMGTSHQIDSVVALTLFLLG